MIKVFLSLKLHCAKKKKLLRNNYVFVEIAFRQIIVTFIHLDKLLDHVALEGVLVLHDTPEQLLHARPVSVLDQRLGRTRHPRDL